jgi:hypothetical protein
MIRLKMLKRLFAILLRFRFARNYFYKDLNQNQPQNQIKIFNKNENNL